MNCNVTVRISGELFHNDSKTIESMTIWTQPRFCSRDKKFSYKALMPNKKYTYPYRSLILKYTKGELRDDTIIHCN